MSSSRRVVLTGMGVVCPLGLDAPSFAQALRAGRSGVRAIRSFDAGALPVRIGGEIDGFDARNYLEKKDRKQLKMMVRTIQLGVAAARLAVDDSRIDLAAIDPARFGVCFGTGTIPGELIDLALATRASLDESTGKIDLHRWGRDAMPTIPPMWMLNHCPNMQACHVSILHNARGPNNTITQSAAASLLALGEAFRIIERGAAEIMLTGGADTRINPISFLRYSLFSQLSHRNDEPEKACRPFDRQRDGQVLAEGGTMLILEEREQARRRGARIYGEVVGFGSAFGLREALEDTPVPVLAVKSYMGNLGTGASTTELAASLLALGEGVMPGTLNHDQPDPDCPVLVAREPRAVTRPCVLKVACTELGQCAAVVVRKSDE
jgi:3-oxoacyl-[acyl-carrier-protein] synthase II